ncbi:hypothetical protein [Halorarum salinum]|uniref:Uncharacterized protein n=1 Tax=Halorarum salinum TaxID=2743089 RepID=A0A7D5QD43_9EURY|nr:hypothetical protein [Halobaculum salinum]QLG63559.1 hypothetical protein HUG12_18225 [Halobaculum salinum]
MSTDDPPRLNVFGKAAAACLLLGLGLLLVGGTAYAWYAAGLLGAAVLAVAVAIGQSDSGTDGPAPDDRDRTDRRADREKEVEAFEDGFS